jgi:subtilisin family serine protease
MRRPWLFLLSTPLFAASFIPNRYIVELSTESVSARVARLPGRNFKSAGASRQRGLVRAEQAAARMAIQQAEGRVLGGTETAMNALFVEIPDAKSGRLANISGVRRVYPEREFHLLLDHALALHHVPQAWTQAGAAGPGAGVKIAFIDTGIDNNHPGFQDSSLTVPGGYPLVASDADLAFTNNKVIVARSYADLFANPDPDPSPQDHVGHGTATAMTAAGVSTVGPLATISGVAPKAWLGSYKVFGTPGVNDSTTEDAILKAIDDAVTDGMDVINLSLGTDLVTRLSDDPEVQMLEAAASLGVVVVAAAGNDGPDPGTISSPAVGPSVIAVGATNNDRFFSGSVVVPGSSALVAIPGNGANSPNPVSAPIMDVSTLDPSGLACTALPAGSLAGSIGLIFRGTCTFETKLNNAAAAGAAGAIIYTTPSQPDPIAMAVGSATLPAEMVSNQDGLALKQQAAAGATVTLQFALGPAYVDPHRLASFSAEGPGVDLTIKPDLVAVGMNLYTAAEKSDPNGAVYSADGYSVEQGTSFSAPLVAGAAAVLKGALPGLTSAQYRSLLIDSAGPAYLVPGTPAGFEQAGAGTLDLAAAINATAAVSPATLSFGAGRSDITATQTLTLSNVGAASDTFQLSAASDNDGPVPQLAVNTIQLGAGGSAPVTVSFEATGLAPGQYTGHITIQGSNSAVGTRVPYWYGVPSQQPHYLTRLYAAPGGQAGTSLPDATLFRISDESGLPVTAIAPTASVVAGDGQVTSVRTLNSILPNVFTLNVRLGKTPGLNVFRISAGGLTLDISIVGQ